MPLFFHPLYTDGIAQDARFPRDRYRRLSRRLQLGEAGELIQIIEAPAAALEDVLVAHERAYATRFLDGSMSLKERRRIGLRPWTPLLIPRTLHLMGGALGALACVAERGGVAGNMAGGTHHAHWDFGSGYCVFNDLAVCARTAHRDYGFKRIMILDLDVHQGDGTATILADDAFAQTISVHCAENFPLRKTQSDRDFAVPMGTGDEAYLEVVDEALAFGLAQAPDLVFFQAGVDGLSADALGRLELSQQGMWRRNQLVFDACLARRIPCVVFMGGGYSKPIDATVAAFEDLFVQAARAHKSLLS